MVNLPADELLSSYRLADLNRAVDEIFDKTTVGKITSHDPHAYLLGGQPGAGKTTLHRIIRAFDPNAVIVNGDNHREHHPNFERIQALFGKDSVVYTQGFANAVTQALIGKLCEGRYNFIVEGTMRDPSVPLNTCKLLKAQGYKVELAIIAVDRNVSWSSTIDRYNEMKAKGFALRATSKVSHDEAADRIPENLNIIYGEGVFDRITLYNRDSECLYDSNITPHTNPHQLLHDIINSSYKREAARGEFKCNREER